MTKPLAKLLFLAAGATDTLAQVASYTASGITGTCSDTSPFSATSTCQRSEWESSLTQDGSAQSTPAFLAANGTGYWWGDWYGGSPFNTRAGKVAYVTFTGPPGSQVAVTPKMDYNARVSVSLSPSPGASSWDTDNRWSFHFTQLGETQTFYFLLRRSIPMNASNGFQILGNNLFPNIEAGGNTFVLKGQALGPTRVVPVNTPIYFDFNIDVTMEKGGRGPVWIVNHATSRAWIPADGPVFDLPPGYSANSPDLNILNNRFMGQAPFPKITSQSGDVSPCAGNSASLFVANTGTGPATYEWFKDGAPVPIDPRISGANTAILQITSIQASDVALYTCTITNDFGSATSVPMRLTLSPADFDGDGTVDLFDYDAFVRAFESQDLLADVNADGVVDIFDYDAFVLAFEAGC